MDQEIKPHIKNADWPKITRRLALYASYRVGRFESSALPMGSSVKAIVQESIQDLLSGKRKWDPKRVDLFYFLKGVVKSKTSHLFALKENELTDTTQIFEERVNIQDCGFNPEQSLIEKERREYLLMAHQKLIELAESNSEYEAVALCIMDGVDKAADIAKKTGVDIKKIYYLKKLWQKDYKKILEEIFIEAN